MKLTPQSAHYYLREMLNIVFGQQVSLPHRWYNYGALNLNKKYDSIEYAIPSHQIQNYRLGRGFSTQQAKALIYLVDCDQFWEIPSNLLSFFFDLPDDRTALRKLLNT